MFEDAMRPPEIVPVFPLLERSVIDVAVEGSNPHQPTRPAGRGVHGPGGGHFPFELADTSVATSPALSAVLKLEFVQPEPRGGGSSRLCRCERSLPGPCNIAHQQWSGIVQLIR